MFKRSMCITRAVLLFAALVCAQESPDGHWESVNNPIGIMLDLTKNVKSEWVASMGMSVPAQNARGPVVLTGLEVQRVTVNGASMSFVIGKVDPMISKFDLTLGEGGTLNGTITTHQGPLPVAFKRTGDARIQRIPASLAVSKELEGDWEGTLEGSGASFRMVFHFKNQPDNTVSASLDIPARSATGIPLNDVKQSGLNVESGMIVANASFQGTLQGRR